MPVRGARDADGYGVFRLVRLTPHFAQDDSYSMFAEPQSFCERLLERRKPGSRGPRSRRLGSGCLS